MAGHCASPPGVPKGIKSFPFLKAIAGLGVKRGRFQGPTEEGCSGSSQLCVPREDIIRPSPGTIGEPKTASLGVAEKEFPHLSTTHV